MNLKMIFGLMMVLCLQTSHAETLADYIFEYNLSGSIASAPELEYLGNDEVFVGGMIDGYAVNALQIESATGLKLDTSQWDLCDAYSIVIHGVMEDITGYRKIIDFRGITSDAGLYAEDGFIYYVLGFEATQQSVFVDEYFQLVMTRDIDQVVNVYVNGENQLSFTDSSSASDMCFSNALHFFKDDLTTNTENPSGAVARVTIYNHELSEDEVGALEILDIIYADGFNPELP